MKLNSLRSQCKTEEEFKRATDLKNQHRNVFGEARRVVQDLKQSAIMSPSDNLFIQIGKIGKYDFVIILFC